VGLSPPVVRNDLIFSTPPPPHRSRELRDITGTLLLVSTAALPKVLETGMSRIEQARPLLEDSPCFLAPFRLPCLGPFFFPRRSRPPFDLVTPPWSPVLLFSALYRVPSSLEAACVAPVAFFLLSRSFPPRCGVGRNLRKHILFPLIETFPAFKSNFLV